MRKPVLMGISNPYDSEPWDPRVPGSSARRLYRMMLLVGEVTEEEFLEAFDRRNLDTHDANFDVDDTVVCLGKRVAGAVKNCSTVFLPHPSGLNRYYNDARNCVKTGEALWKLIRC